MGARNRKRRAIQRDAEKIRQQESEALPPLVAQVSARGKVANMIEPPRMHVSERPTPDHVVERMSRGHQYVKGDRAPSVNLTRAERQRNVRDRREFAAYTADHGVKVTRVGNRRKVHVPTGRVVEREVVTRTEVVHASRRVRAGEERVERWEQQVEYNEAIVAGRTFVREDNWHGVRVTRVSD